MNRRQNVTKVAKLPKIEREYLKYFVPQCPTPPPQMEQDFRLPTLYRQRPSFTTDGVDAAPAGVGANAKLERDSREDSENQQ